MNKFCSHLFASKKVSKEPYYPYFLPLISLFYPSIFKRILLLLSLHFCYWSLKSLPEITWHCKLLLYFQPIVKNQIFLLDQFVFYQWWPKNNLLLHWVLHNQNRYIHVFLLLKISLRVIQYYLSTHVYQLVNPMELFKGV